MKENLDSDKSLRSALIKKAIGYDAEEIIEEYSLSEEGEIKLTKKKVTKKNVPPDVTAIKILIDGEDYDVKNLSDSELEKEKERLFKLLEKTNKKEKKGEKNKK